MYYELTDRFIVSADAQRTWEFFSSAANLPLITPPWLAFKVLTPPPIAIGSDALLDYTIRWAKIPIRWRTRIIDWSPPRQFIDLQIRGPYALWHHQHVFEPATEGGTRCADRVIYRIGVPLLGRAIHAAFVRRQLLEIFRFRREAIARELGWVGAIQQDVETRRL